MIATTPTETHAKCKEISHNESLNAWHDRLKEAIALSMNENLPDLIRHKQMRSPIYWETRTNYD